NPSPLAAGGTVIRYRHVSLLTSTPAEWRAISKGCEKEFWKCVVLERAQPQLREVLQAIAAAPPAPLLFHCVAGKDRTGLVAALLLALADVEPEAIAQDYSASTRLLSDPYLKRYADVDPADVLENVRCPEAGVHNMLAFLKSQGGIRTYLRDIGLGRADIQRLRSRLRE
ncbi:MAG TPA: tyrosine-protein phosphatase, partial [Steroidobacteraceae bacterium]|nr:tyrosine-protein phosphatase [Steroidobacteraceae bacterium]